MPSRIEDYALIGDTHTAALVAKDCSIDWLCLPRFDSGAVFAALLGSERHGRWTLTPVGSVERVTHRYRGHTLILDTEVDTEGGAIRVTDFMPHRHHYADVVRIVEGIRGRVPMRMELVMRFDYGSVVPWVRKTDQGLWAIAGPDALMLRTNAPLRGEGLTTVADFAVGPGDRVPFVLSWHPSHEPIPPRLDADALLEETVARWEAWSARCTVSGRWREAVVRSLITLKALTYEPTGGIGAGPGGAYAAAEQFHLDVYGEVMDALHQARSIGVEPEASAWALQRALLDFLESNWDRPDEGIWEVRGPRRPFTHSRVMAWVAMDRAVKAVERFGLDGPVERWRRLRSTIHQDVC